MKILIGIPFDSIDSNPSRDFKVPERIGVHECVPYFYDTKDVKGVNKIWFARERICDKAKEIKVDKLIFLDSDVITKGDELLPLIESGHPVTFGRYVCRSYWDKDYERNYRLIEGGVNPGGLLKGASGCLCIDKVIFNKLKAPYFQHNGVDVRDDELMHFRNNLKTVGLTMQYSNVRVGHQDRKTHKIYYLSDDEQSFFIKEA